MANNARFKTTYTQAGVQIPYEHGAGTAAYGDATFAADGFLLVAIFRTGVYVVQSLADREFYLVKIRHRIRRNLHVMGHNDFAYNHPPELRISDHPNATIHLPDQPHFPKLVFYQTKMNGNQFDLYFKYHNGGTLADFRRKHYVLGRRIPEHFIWHVAAELTQALAFMHYGQPEGGVRVPGWIRSYHRDLDANNIMLHFRPKRPGRQPNAGSKDNAFPEIILTDFGESAIRNDPPAHIRPGLFNTQVLRAREDVYMLGWVLRSLCMAHVPFPADDDNNPRNDIPGQIKNESYRWYHRPDSRSLASVNAHLTGPAYSGNLMNMLRHFEWHNQANSVIENGNWGLMPSMNWVVTTLRTTAKAEVDGYLDGRKPAGYYTALDVSWAKPSTPMPFVANPIEIDPGNNASRNLAAIEAVLRTDLERGDYTWCGLEYPIPKMKHPLPAPP
ncbi:hypothetical protein AAE478_002839 [Parahypoxylon ruwenzoriense]